MKKIYSDYYDRYFNEEEIEDIYEIYLDWCDDMDREPIVDDPSEIDEDNIDYIVNKAEMQGYRIE